MRDVITFCVDILVHIVGCLFSLDIGGYSFGDFLTACLVVSVFISSLVVSFKGAGGSPGSAVRPPRPHQQSKGRPSGKSG